LQDLRTQMRRELLGVREKVQSHGVAKPSLEKDSCLGKKFL
jgi:hypothetical protein